MRGETAIFQLPRRLSSLVNKLIIYLKSVGYSIDNYRSWTTEENDLFLSITAGQQINMDDEIPAYLEAVKRKRCNL